MKVCLISMEIKLRTKKKIQKKPLKEMNSTKLNRKLYSTNNHEFTYILFSHGREKKGYM